EEAVSGAVAESGGDEVCAASVDVERRRLRGLIHVRRVRDGDQYGPGRAEAAHQGVHDVSLINRLREGPAQGEAVGGTAPWLLSQVEGDVEVSSVRHLLDADRRVRSDLGQESREIGRASCRERVELWEGAGAVKK